MTMTCCDGDTGYCISW